MQSIGLGDGAAGNSRPYSSGGIAGIAVVVALCVCLSCVAALMKKRRADQAYREDNIYPASTTAAAYPPGMVPRAPGQPPPYPGAPPGMPPGTINPVTGAAIPTMTHPGAYGAYVIIFYHIHPLLQYI
jgi:hypothetical protein